MNRLQSRFAELLAQVRGLVFGFIIWTRGIVGRDRYLLVLVEGSFPARLRHRRLYVLTEDGEPWEARLICPCGCGAQLDLNLLPDEHPRWKFSADSKGRATLNPSVWRQVGCASHFFLRDGKVIWC